MKIINFEFNPDTKITKIVLADKYGQYIGTAKLHPDDTYSHIVGGNIAEQRALIKKFSEDIKRYRHMLKAIKDLQKDIQNNNLNIDSKINRRFNIFIRNYSQEISFLKEDISEIKKGIKEALELRNKIIEKSKAKNK